MAPPSAPSQEEAVADALAAGQPELAAHLPVPGTGKRVHSYDHPRDRARLAQLDSGDKACASSACISATRTARAAGTPTRQSNQTLPDEGLRLGMLHRCPWDGPSARRRASWGSRWRHLIWHAWSGVHFSIQIDPMDSSPMTFFESSSTCSQTMPPYSFCAWLHAAKISR